jgi:hypothetical protein
LRLAEDGTLSADIRDCAIYGLRPDALSDEALEACNSPRMDEEWEVAMAASMIYHLAIKGQLERALPAPFPTGDASRQCARKCRWWKFWKPQA